MTVVRFIWRSPEMSSWILCSTLLKGGMKLRSASTTMARAISMLSFKWLSDLFKSRYLDAMNGLPSRITSHPMWPLRKPSIVSFFLYFHVDDLLHESQGHPHREKLYEIGHRFKQRFHQYFGGEDDVDQERYPPMPTGSCRVQAVRSVSDWSHGVLMENSIQQACSWRSCLFIPEIE